MPQESIIDTSRPNAGRIYDYLLGGNHNFEVDRQAADQIRKSLPFLPKALRLQRWCLQDIARELTNKRGFNVIVDFASGLPTNDHMHTVARPGTTVIYSDHDPVVVEYAHEILANTPNVYYFQADARRPDELLSRPEVKEILGDGRDVALVFWGIGIFLTDDDVSQAAQTLHRWAGPKACLAFNAQAADVSADDPRVAEVAKMYQQMGSAIFFRSLDRYQQLVKPWRTDEQGFVSLLDWHGVSTSEMGKEDRQSFGPSGGAFGGYLVK